MKKLKQLGIECRNEEEKWAKEDLESGLGREVGWRWNEKAFEVLEKRNDLEKYVGDEM